MAIARWEDVQTAIGRPITDEAEQAQVTWWLDGIEMLIKSRLGDPYGLDQDIVKYVEVEAVAAKIRRNGQTESSITVAVDDGNVTRRWENAVSGDDITSEWWELLAPKTESLAFSTRPGHQPDPCWRHPHARTTY